MQKLNATEGDESHRAAGTSGRHPACREPAVKPPNHQCHRSVSPKSAVWSLFGHENSSVPAACGCRGSPCLLSLPASGAGEAWAVSGARLAVPKNRHELLGGEGSAFDRQLPHTIGSGAAVAARWGQTDTDRQMGTRAPAGGGRRARHPPPAQPSPLRPRLLLLIEGEEKKKTKPKALRNFPLALTALATMWPGRLLRAGKRRARDNAGQNCLHQLEAHTSSWREAQQLLGFGVIWFPPATFYDCWQQAGTWPFLQSDLACCPSAILPPVFSCWDEKPSL